MNEQDNCNHRYNRYECVKCGKKMPGSKKIPNYKIEKAAHILADQFMAKAFKGLWGGRG